MPASFVYKKGGFMTKHTVAVIIIVFVCVAFLYWQLGKINRSPVYTVLGKTRCQKIYEIAHGVGADRFEVYSFGSKTFSHQEMEKCENILERVSYYAGMFRGKKGKKVYQELLDFAGRDDICGRMVENAGNQSEIIVFYSAKEAKGYLIYSKN